MKKFLAIILALVMCVSVFVSCSKDPENDNKEKAEDIASIVEAIEEVNLKDLVTTIVDTAFNSETQISLEDLMAELSKINAETDVTFNKDSVAASVYAGVKDGIIKMSVQGQSAYMFFNEAQLISLTPSEFGYEISTAYDVTDDLPAIIGGADLSQYKEMVDMYLTDEVLAALEGFELKIDASQIKEKDGFYFLSEKVFINIGNEILDTVVEVMKALDAPADELPTDDELAESKTELEEMIKSMNLKLGFSVKNKKVNGIKFETEFNPNEIGAAKENVVDTPVAYSATASKAEAESEEKISVSFTVMFDSETMLPESLDMSMILDKDGEKTEYVYNMSYLYNADGMPVGCDLKFEISMGNMYLGDYDSDSKDGYIEIKGSQKYSGTVKLDFSKLSEVGATIVDVNFSMSAKANEYINCYSKANGDWVEEVITDSNKIKEIEQAECYLKSGSLTANAKVEKAGVVEFNFSMKEDAKVTASASGSFSWTAAPNYGTIPADVRENFINNKALAATLERLTSEAETRIANIYMSNPEDYNYYTWYDTESGIWTRINRWNDIEFFTLQPSDCIVIN